MSQKHIPNEILCCIFSHLPEGSVPLNHFAGLNDLLNCSLVSRAWRAVVLPTLWNNFNASDSTPAKLKLLASSLAESHTSLVPGHIDRASLIKSFAFCGSVDHDPFDIISSIIVILQLLSPTHLEEILIRFVNCPALPSALFPSQLRNLKRFTFRGLCEPRPHQNTFLQNLPESLEILSLGSASKPCSGAISNPINFDRLSTLPHLTSLELYGLRTIPPLILEQGLRTWSHRLRRLTIKWCDRLCRDSLIRILCDHCPNLTILKLIMQADKEDRALCITEAALCNLVDACPRLEHLYLWKIPGATNEFLAACAARAVQLRKLHLFLCPQVTGAGISEVGAWSNLEVLIIIPKYRQMIDEAFVHVVKEGCPKIQRLILKKTIL